MDKHIINLATEGFPQDEYGNMLAHFMNEWAATYHLDSTYAYDYCVEDKSGREVFTEWLRLSGRLNIRSFHFEYKSKRFDNRMLIGQGFEINKDEALTMALLKAENAG